MGRSSNRRPLLVAVAPPRGRVAHLNVGIDHSHLSVAIQYRTKCQLVGAGATVASLLDTLAR